MNKTRGTCGECKTFEECAIKFQAMSMVLRSDKPSCADFERADSLDFGSRSTGEAEYDPQEWSEIFKYCPNCGAKVVE